MNTDEYLEMMEDNSAGAMTVSAEAKKNPYLQMMEDYESQHQAQFRSSVTLAVDSNPDEIARKKRIANMLGTPLAAVEGDPVTAKQLSTIKTLENDTKDAPALRQKYTDLDFTKLALDQSSSLGVIERTARNLAAGFGGDFAGSGIRGMGQTLYALERLTGSKSLLAEALTNVGETTKKYWQNLAPTDQGFSDQVVRGVGQMAGQLPLFAVSMPAGFGMMYGQGADQMVDKIERDKAAQRSSQTAQDLEILSGGAITAVTEWAASKLMLNPPQLLALKSKLLSYSAKVALGGVEEGVQETLENLGQDISHIALTNRESKIAWGEAIEAGGVGAIVGTIASSVINGALHIRTRGSQKAFQDLSDATKAQQLRERDPETYQGFADAVASHLANTSDGAVENIYVDANTLSQVLAEKNIDLNEVAKIIPSIGEQIEEAKATGGDIVLPLNEYIGKMAGTDVGDLLGPHLRSTPDSPSMVELDAAAKINGDMQAKADEIISKQEQRGEFIKSANEVQKTIYDQITATGVYTPAAARSYASFIRDFYVTQAGALGVSPTEMYEKFPYKIQAGEINADQATQLAKRDYISAKPIAKEASLIKSLREQKAQNPELGASPTFKNKKIVLTHWSVSPKLTATDPTFHGSHHRGAEFGKSVAGRGSTQFYLPMTYFGINKYEKEMVIGPHRYGAVVNGNDMYDMDADPLDLFPPGGLEMYDKYGVMGYPAQMEIFRYRIAHAGFKGAISESNHIATMFVPTRVAPVKPGVKSLSQKTDANSLYQNGKINIESPEFKAWFGDSKVVDEAGKPLVVYHGTNERVSSFNEGVTFFTPDKTAATNYAYERSEGGKGHVLSAYLKMENPKVVDYREEGDNDIYQDAIDAQEEGYDGLIALNTDDGNKIIDQYMVFSPTQIKSVNNRGTWNPNDPNILHQSEDADKAWRNWEPEVTSTGKIKGAPEWVNDKKDLNSLRALIRKFSKEGASGRYWYENSADTVMRMTNGDVVKAEKFIQLLAIYSPNSNIWVNTLQAIKAYTHWAVGLPVESFSVGSGIGDAKAIDVLYNNKDWEGRKTNSFYLNLMHDIVTKYPDSANQLKLDPEFVKALSLPVTVDVWIGRAFGYDSTAFSNDKGTGKYSFSENEIRRLTAELNEKLPVGERPWDPHQVQATIWTAIKSRYEMKDVKEKTNRKSLREGVIRIVDGRPEYPKDAEEMRKHLTNWRHFAMQPTSAEVAQAANDTSRSFGDDLDRMTEVITWEAIPSTSIQYDIHNASPEAKKLFTVAAKSLLMDENGNDLLAYMLGVPLSYSGLGYGAYAGGVNPNVLSHILPAREAGQKGFSVKEVRDYCRAIQYIFKQDAVPWFRADNRILLSDHAAKQQKFRVVNRDGKSIRTFDTQAEAEAYAKPKGYEVKGGDLARAFNIQFGKNLDSESLAAVLSPLKEYLGEDAGFTRTAANEITIVNFRDDNTKLPFVYDEVFLSAVEDFIEDNGALLGVVSHKKMWAEGEYGHVQNWTKSPEGTEILNSGSIPGRPDLSAWIRDRRDAFDKLLAEYSGESLAAIEQQSEGSVFFQSGFDAETERIFRELTSDVAITEMYQKMNGAKRGGFNPTTLTNILTTNADYSTFMHESAHFFLTTYAQMASDPNAPARVQEDMQTLLDWFGIPDLATWNSMTLEEQRKHHEAFAYNFENYLFDGKAPNAKMQSVFERFSAWLKRIYVSIRDELNAIYKQEHGTDLPILTGEVKQVMDRMLASDDQIEQAEKIRGMAPIFQTQAEAKMTDEEWAAYEDMQKGAHEEATAKHRAASLREMKWLSNMKGRMLKSLQDSAKEIRKGVMAEVTEEINNLPLYRAQAELKGANEEESLALADALGYGSVDELKAAIKAAPKKSDVIKETTDRRMLEEYGELTNPKSLDRAVNEAVHNQARARFIGVELRHLSKSQRPVRVMQEAARQAARAVLGKRAIKNIRPNDFTAAEAKASLAAEKAMREGDFAAAAQQKEYQLLQNQLASEALKANEGVAKALSNFKKVFVSDKRIGKTRDMNYVNTARAILAHYGFGTSEEPASAYLSKIKAYDPEFYAEIEDMITAHQLQAKPINDMSLDDFADLSDQISALWHLSKRNKQIEINGQLMDRKAVVEELNAATRALTKNARPGYDKAISKWQDTKIKLLGMKAALRRVEAWVDTMDSGNPNGPFRKYVWNPVSEAIIKYRGVKVDYLTKYLEMLKSVGPLLKSGPVAAPEIGYTFNTKDNNTELLHALLHTGNESNKRKLLLGRNWAELKEDGKTLDTSKWDAFIARAEKEGIITKAHYDFAQNLWNMLESMKPEAQKAHRQMYGFYFNEISATPFQTSFGVYAGGYVPAVTDPRLVTESAMRNEKETTSVDNSYMFPTTGRGFTKARVEYNKPLLLNLGYMASHIDKVLRFTYIEPHVKDVARIVKTNRAFADAMDALDQTVRTDMLIPWLQRSAMQMSTIPSKGAGGRGLDAVASWLRINTGMQIMVGNITNTLQQFTGLSIAALKVSPKYLRTALWLYMRHPQDTAQMALDKSEYMKTRMTGVQYEVQQAVDELLLNPNKYEKLQDFAHKHGYFLQQATQGVVDNITWMGAYNQAIEEGADEKDAVRRADSAVRMTQGSFAPEDSSRIEVGSPFVRLFSQFYSYFNMQANILGSEFVKAARNLGVKDGAGKMLYIYTFGFMIPAVLSDLIVQAMSGIDVGDDDEFDLTDALALFFSAQGRTAAAMIPGVGQAVVAGARTWNNRMNDDRISASPAVTAIEGLVRAPHSVYKAIADDGSWSRASKDFLTGLGMITRIPLGQLGKPVGYLLDVEQGKAQPESGMDYARGLVSGKDVNRKQ